MIIHRRQFGQPNCTFVSMAMVTDNDEFASYVLKTDNWGYHAIAAKLGYGVITVFSNYRKRLYRKQVNKFFSCFQKDSPHGNRFIVHLLRGHTVAVELLSSTALRVYDPASMMPDILTRTEFVGLNPLTIEMIVPHSHEYFKEYKL